MYIIENSWRAGREICREGERQMRRKLIAMDLDGTAVDSQGRLAPGVKEAILAARADGHLAAFVTGRADTDMAPLDGDCDCVDYMILNNGAKLMRGSDLSVLDNEVLDAEEVERLFGFCRQAGIQIYAISGRECYASMYSERLARYMDSIGCTPRYVEDFCEIPADRIEGVTILGDAAAVLEAVEKEGFKLRAVISEPCCVDVMNPLVNKWRGLQILLSRLGMTPEDVVAVGDYDNDLEMIRHAGIGVAVGNARACVKAGADYVTVRDNDQGAVADVINELILGRGQGLCIKN